MTPAELSGQDLHPLLALMRRYAYAYTASHDFDVCPELMVDNYRLCMGRHRLTGRDEVYVPATRRQFDQFPGLGFTIHDVVCNGERVALRFSEHGRSGRTGTGASWSGVSTYRWDGRRLTDCWVEQDYDSRRRQLETRVSLPVEAPALDPWTHPVEAPDPVAEEAFRSWLGAGGLDDCAPGSLDDEVWWTPGRIGLEVHGRMVDDLFSAGARVAFHLTETGTYTGGLPGLEAAAGRPVIRYAAGVASVTGNEIEVRAVTDRLSIRKELAADGPAPGKRRAP